jgi:hypothetical protein
MEGSSNRMKKNDIAAIVLIVMFASVFSYIAAANFIGTPENNPVQVEVVTPVNDTFKTPDSRIFNEQAIDPTVEIRNGSQGSERPFTN